MSGTTHILLGTAATICVTQPTTKTELIAATLVGALGSMIADIDTDNSKISTFFRSGLFLLILFGYLQLHYGVVDVSSIYQYMETQFALPQMIGCFVFLLLLLLGTFTKHRHVTHSIEYTLLLCVCMYFIQPSFVLPLAIGLLSHIVLDLLNYKKVRLSLLFKLEFAFKICASDGAINTLLTTVGLIAMYLMTALT